MYPGLIFSELEEVKSCGVPSVNCIRDLSTLLSVQNCLVRCDSGTFTVVVGDFGLAEKIPDYRSVK